MSATDWRGVGKTAFVAYFEHVDDSRSWEELSEDEREAWEEISKVAVATFILERLRLARAK